MKQLTGIQIIVFVIFIITLILYVLGAFIAGTFNTNNWYIIGKIVFGIIWAIANIGLIVFLIEEKIIKA